jgi:non-ribosomal peptide synthetase component F
MYEHYFQATLAPDLLRRIRDAQFQIPTWTAVVQGEVALRFPELPLAYARLYHIMAHVPPVLSSALFSDVLLSVAVYYKLPTASLRNKRYTTTGT